MQPWTLSGDDSRPVITPKQQIEAENGETFVLPKTALVFYMSHAVEHLVQNEQSKKITDRFPRFLGACPVYKIGNVCILHGGRGAPQAADTMEMLAAYGVKRVVVAGMCGVYREDLNLGDILIPQRAYVEEGTSLHYYEAIEYACPDETLTEAARSAFPESRSDSVVTCDAVYRQTFQKEQHWREKGCGGVEMEASALMSVGKARNVAVTVILLASDKHPVASDVASWQWKITREQRAGFAERCLTFAQSI